MYPPVCGGALGPSRHLRETEPRDPVLRIGRDRSRGSPQRLLAVAKPCCRITKHNVRLG